MIAPPAMTNQELVVYFFGEKIEKIGPKKYKITNGGFSTCVQPTPRWDLNAGTVILNLDHYTLLKQAVLRVKGVPVFYLPVMYYPTKREDRATGFLHPDLRIVHAQRAVAFTTRSSGRSTAARTRRSPTTGFRRPDRARAPSIATTWAPAKGSFGRRTRNQKATQYENGGTLPDSRSYDIRAAATQTLPYRLRARANVSYFSSIQSSQLNNVNIYDLSRNSRSYGGNLVGNWGKYSMNSTFDHSEYFYNTTNSVLSGTWPRVSFSRNERPILNSPLYFSVSTEAREHPARHQERRRSRSTPA